MILGSDEMDRLLTSNLNETGPLLLTELAEKTGQDARYILRRLHAMTGKELVKCEGDAGSLYWRSTGKKMPRKYVKRERQAPVKIIIPKGPSPVNNDPIIKAQDAQPALLPKPVVEPKAEPVPRRRYDAMVVRPEVMVTELKVTPNRTGAAIITDGDIIREAAVGEAYEVYIPRENLKGLITALSRVYMEYAP